MPASRPQVTKKGHTYYGKSYRRWRDQAQILLREMKAGPQPIAGPVAILMEVIGQRPKKTHRYAPQGDNDNFEKAAWDAVTKAKRFWHDDDQVIFNASLKRYARGHETPGIRLLIYSMELPNNA